ncbi:MAG TPA: hypothetical protein VG893_03700 [Terracidiphilus sp.]|nr:hypothetical protein [Terracidiphilus sp.]
MIRQAISCDICGTDKQQTNHWFVAYEQNGELRIAGWRSQSRLRAGTKHLCGQTCLHKLVDEFMAKNLADRPAVQEKPEAAPARPASARVDTTLTSVAAHAAAPGPVPVPTEAYVDEFESSARLIQADLVDAPPAFNSRAWRSEAWKREREREQRVARRRSIA